MTGFFTAPRISLGPGAIEQLGGLDAHRVFLLVDPALERLARVKHLSEEVEKTGATIERSGDVEIEPTVTSVARLGDKLRAFHPDWIVAVGGGSTIDTAKGAWVRSRHPEWDLAHVTPLVEFDLRPETRFVAVPSTSGSGSEASWQAHVWTAEGDLIELASRELIPDWALLDPELPLSLSRSATADGVADLLGHAIEAWTSEWANPFSDAFARAATDLVVNRIPSLSRRGDDMDLRADVHYAATMAGLAVSNASTGNAHALAHALHYTTGLPHGRLVGIVLPYVIDFNGPVARERLLEIASVVGTAPGSYRGGLGNRVRDLLGSLGIPATLEAAGVGWGRVEADLPKIIHRAMESSSARANPRVASAHEWVELIHLVTTGMPSGPAPVARS